MSEMKLIGLDGLHDVDTSVILKSEALKVLKRLPDGDAVELIKQLPESVIRKICENGVSEEITKLLPPAIACGTLGVVVGLISKSPLIGIGSALLAFSAYMFISGRNDEKAPVFHPATGDWKPVDWEE